MEPEQKSNGALIGLIIIVVILIIGGAYIWKTNVKKEPEPASNNTTELQAEIENIDIENIDSGI